jgi:hypothetical protein
MYFSMLNLFYFLLYAAFLLITVSLWLGEHGSLIPEVSEIWQVK